MIITVLLFSIGILLIGGIVLKFGLSYNIKRKYLFAREKIFGNKVVSLPRVTTNNSYGSPSITLIFKNEDDLKKSEKDALFELFKEEIQRIHNNIDGFDAEIATNFELEIKK